MAVKLGSDDVSFRLGAGEVAAVYLGSQEVWSAGPPATVPGAPTITSATDAGGDTEVTYTAPADDGGSAITSYKFYLDGVEASVLFSSSGYALLGGGGTGAVVEVSAVNAIGEGPKSAPFVVNAAAEEEE
jgi:endo-1,4-beta-xylanase